MVAVRRGILGLSLEMILALVITAIVIFIIYAVNSNIAPGLMEGVQEIICIIPFVCP